MLPILRTRLALALIAAVVVALELTLMRGLAIRLSSHFAGIVISVGLLGFGAAGSFLTLSRTFIIPRQRAALIVLACLLAISIPATWWLSQNVNLNVNYLMWNISTEAPKVFLMELYMLVPFAFAGAFIGIVLMDAPKRVNGHYASDLLGSGLGGILSVLAMNALAPAHLLIATAITSLSAALLLLQWKNWRHLVILAVGIAIVLDLATLMPWVPTPNQYKPLTLARNFPGTQTIYHAEGPLGQLDVIQGPMLHGAPQLSFQYFGDPPLPPHVELYTDADDPTLIFDRHDLAAWEFIDYRTAALPFFVRGQSAPPPKVCITDAGGGVEIGLALYHDSPDVTALQLNPQIIAAMRGPLKDYGGSIYDEPGVHILNQEPRGFFASTSQSFDIIQFPPTGGFGAAGSDATHESYAYTIESIRQMFHHLNPGGILAITRGINAPPREELRAFDLAAQALRAENLPPDTHLAMIRGGLSCTILVTRDPLSDSQLAGLKTFSRRMGFDYCYFPGLQDKDANPKFATTGKYGNYNYVDTPFYTQGPQALLGTPRQRAEFLEKYPFDLSAPADNKPFFFHMFEWKSYGELKRIHGNVAPYLEVSYIMLLVCLVQAIVLGVILILLPLTPGFRTIRVNRGKTATFAYFLMLGLGFMFLEMGFLQKLVLYLSHPIYAAAVVIASFLVFAGLGSFLSSRWRSTARDGSRTRVAHAAAAAAIGVSLLFLAILDPWLALTQSWPLVSRCIIAALTIGPLALALGHLFPLGLQRTAAANPGLVPWAWAVNGFASVVAAATAPLLAMLWGFGSVIWLAIGCYVLAGAVFGSMPLEGAEAPAAVPQNARE